MKKTIFKNHGINAYEIDRKRLEAYWGESLAKAKKEPKKRRHLDDPYTNEPIYHLGTLPEVNIVDDRMPINYGDSNVIRLANEIDSGRMSLTQIPDAKLRNLVKAKPIVDKIRRDTDIAALQVGVPLLSATALPMIGSVAVPVLPQIGYAMGHPFSTTIRLASKLAPKARRLSDAAGVADSLFDVGTTIEGVKNAFSNNGVQKTIEKARQGDIYGTIKSGAGDVFDISGAFNYIKPIVNTARRTRSLAATMWDILSPFDKLANETILGKNLWFDVLMRNKGMAKPSVSNAFIKMITSQPIENTKFAFTGPLSRKNLSKLYRAGLFKDYSGLKPVDEATAYRLKKELSSFFYHDYDPVMGNYSPHIDANTPVFELPMTPNNGSHTKATYKLKSNNYTGWRNSSKHNNKGQYINYDSEYDVAGHLERRRKDSDGVWTDEIFDLQHFSPEQYSKTWLHNYWNTNGLSIKRKSLIGFSKLLGRKIALNGLNRAWTPFGLYGKVSY